eukprot:2527893-Prymnesium_polylepis.1
MSFWLGLRVVLAHIFRIGRNHSRSSRNSRHSRRPPAPGRSRGACFPARLCVAMFYSSPYSRNRLVRRKAMGLQYESANGERWILYCTKHKGATSLHARS